MNIESNIPIPKTTRKGKWKEVLGKLEVGQSVFFDVEQQANSFRYAGIYHGYKMRFRKMDRGWRVWRVE